jgi:ABC-type multidrug transport system fused ATPase/permease subunit
MLKNPLILLLDEATSTLDIAFGVAGARSTRQAHDRWVDNHIQIMILQAS